MRVISIFGSSKTGQGPWRAGEKIRSFALFGVCEFDFRQAELAEGGTKMKATTILGAHRIIVPPGMPVSVSGFSILGANRAERSQTKEMPSTFAKELQIRAWSILGCFKARE